MIDKRELEKDIIDILLKWEVYFPQRTADNCTPVIHLSYHPDIRRLDGIAKGITCMLWEKDYIKERKEKESLNGNSL